MSKESKPADRWRQLYAAAHGRTASYCVGCGYHYSVHGEHRADCTRGLHESHPDGIDRPVHDEVSHRQALVTVINVFEGHVCIVDDRATR